MQLTTPTTTLDAADLTALRVDLAGLDADTFSLDFYRELFDVAPGVRGLFPSDLTEQRRKLMAELGTLISMVAGCVDGRLDATVARLHDLGARHAAYGAEPEHYAVVGTVLLATLQSHVPAWDVDHERRWTGVYTLVATTMQDGAGRATHDVTFAS